MEETLKVGVCSRCGRHAFSVRAATAGDETRDVCARCRKATGAVPVAPECSRPAEAEPLVCVCGPSPTHAHGCPWLEVRT